MSIVNNDTACERNSVGSNISGLGYLRNTAVILKNEDICCISQFIIEILDNT